MKKWIFAGVLIAVLSGIGNFYIKTYFEPAKVGDLTAQSKNAKYIDSEMGSTRYEVHGKGGDTIVLIHAFNGFVETWNPNIGALVNAGFKVVVYDLWGRGLSDRPKVDYDLSIFRSQLDTVIKSAGVEKIHLVASSFGSVIASDYAVHHPEKVSKVIFIGPAGWPKDNDIQDLVSRLPILPDLVFFYFGESVLAPIVKSYLNNPASHQWVLDKWVEYAKLPGFYRSILSTMRHSPVRDYTEGWRQFGTLPIESMFIWGKDDVSFPYENAEKAKQLIPKTVVKGIDGAAHWVNIEKPDQVNSFIVEFIKR